jgi:Ca2+-binding RTX toxin-like protein
MPNGPSSSQSPYLVSVEPNVRFVSLLTTGDAAGVKANGSPWVMPGIPDGLGAFDNGNGTITVLMNHELGATAGAVRDHGSAGAFVSRIVIDKETLRVVDAQDLAKSVYLYDTASSAFVQGTTAWNRFCSGDLADSSAFFNSATGKGTPNRIYLTGEEAGAEGRAFAIVVTDTDGVGANEAGRAYELPWMGNLSFENVVAAPGSGDKTVVIALDDSTPGQLYLYVGDKAASGTTIERAGLTNGQLYGIAVPEVGANAGAETSATSFVTSTFSLKPITGAATMTGAQIETASDSAGVSEFFRPEDGAWDPTHPNWFYFVTTASFTDKSRLYRLEFNDIKNPTAGGVIRTLLDGSEGQRMMDNLTVTRDGRVILQEDIGNQSALGKVWVYDPATDQLSQLAEHDPARFTSGQTGFLTQDEESSGVIDVTSLLGGTKGEAYLLDVQAHYSIPGELVEGGQLLAMFVDRPAAATWGGDSINGGAGAETLVGEMGADLIRAGSGDDRIDAGMDADTVSAGAGNDTVLGGMGADSLQGDAGDDWLDGGFDADVLVGGAGADTLVGGFGSDTLTGGEGADRFVVEVFWVDTVTDFQPGVDKLVVPASRGAFTTSVIDADGDGARDDLLLTTDVGSQIRLLNLTTFGPGDWTVA